MILLFKIKDIKKISITIWSRHAPTWHDPSSKPKQDLSRSTLNNINLLITKWVCKIYISLQLHVLEPLKMLWAGGIFYFIIVNNIIGLLKLHYYNQIIFSLITIIISSSVFTWSPVSIFIFKRKQLVQVYSYIWTSIYNLNVVKLIIQIWCTKSTACIHWNQRGRY